jgi:hypothetical protein
VIETAKIEHILLEKTLLAFSRLIPKYRLEEWQAGISVRQFPDIADEFSVILHAWFLNGHKTDNLTERDTFEFPASPWEFFKQEYAPKWFLRRYPVKMQTKEFRVSVHHHYVCPHIEVPNDKGPLVHYAWMGKMSGQISPDETGQMEDEA